MTKEEFSELDLWSIVIGFTKSVSRFPTPFRNAGYSFHTIEPLVKGKTPDLISSKPHFWIITDLTLNDKKDYSKLNDYKYFNSEILARIASPHYKKKMYGPSVLVIGSINSVTKEKCKENNLSGLVVMPTCIFYDYKSLVDKELIMELTNLKSVPDNPPTTFLAVPESKGMELTKAVGAVLFTKVPPIDKSPEEFFPRDISIDILRDEISLFSPNSIDKLSRKIKKNLIDFKNGKGKGLISYNQKRESFRFNEIKSIQTLTKIRTAIEDWTQSGHLQETVDSFI